MKEKDPIGFDPVKWVERLMDVNEGSQFSPREKDQINHALKKLRRELEDLS